MLTLYYATMSLCCMLPRRLVVRRSTVTVNAKFYCNCGVGVAVVIRDMETL
jgi:hypothetical protein